MLVRSHALMSGPVSSSFCLFAYASARPRQCVWCIHMCVGGCVCARVWVVYIGTPALPQLLSLPDQFSWPTQWAYPVMPVGSLGYLTRSVHIPGPSVGGCERASPRIHMPKRIHLQALENICRTSGCRRLLTPRADTIVRFLWQLQDDLVSVAHFMADCFDYFGSGGVPHGCILVNLRRLRRVVTTLEASPTPTWLTEQSIMSNL
jgi:hypothetical protein